MGLITLSCGSPAIGARILLNEVPVHFALAASIRSIRHHAADAFVEGLVDVGRRHRVGDRRVDLDLVGTIETVPEALILNRCAMAAVALPCVRGVNAGRPGQC